MFSGVPLDMTQYRTKSALIEAIPFTGGRGSSQAIITEFLPGTGYKARRNEGVSELRVHGEFARLADTEHLLLKHGDALPVRIEVGDWLIKNSFGTIYVMPGADFDATYELVPASAPLAGTKTFAQLLQERRASGLTAADIPKSYDLGVSEREALVETVRESLRWQEDDPAQAIVDALIADGYSMGETEPDERIEAWDAIARHPFFRECYLTDDTLLNAMLAKLRTRPHTTAAGEREAIGQIVWETSHADEGTISATGANIIADALTSRGYMRLPLAPVEPTIEANPGGAPA